MSQAPESIVAIRVDSSERMGSGHLMRCLTLAERMREKGKKVHFICRALPGNLAALVKQRGFSLHLLPYEGEDTSLAGYAAWLAVPMAVDAEETREILKRIAPAERLVVDHYGLDREWEQRLRPLVKEIFVIDDLANRSHDCDILLDQNFYRNREKRYLDLVPKTCRLLLGPQYALLRQEFYQAQTNLRQRDGKLRRILLFYGGSDRTRETEKAIAALLKLRLFAVQVDVVVGGSNARSETVRALCEKQQGFQYHFQVTNMAELMACADLSLGAGGTTMWERCFLGLPAVVTAIAENQLEICQDCAEAGLIRYLGKWNEVSPEDIAGAVEEFSQAEKLRAFQQSCCLRA